MEVDLLWLSVGVVIGILAGGLTVLLVKLDFWIMKYREFQSSLNELRRQLDTLRESMGLQPLSKETRRKEAESTRRQQRNLDYLDDMREELNRLREEIRRSLRR